MDDRILFYSRKSDYGWLSNFYLSNQVVDGIGYMTNEHYYQSKKAKDKKMQEWIRNAPTPYAAMCAGRALRMGEVVSGWDDIKRCEMFNGLVAKFYQNPELRKKLIATEGKTLHEDSPTDMYWGVKGEDMLGKTLMELREFLIKDKDKNK